MAGLKPPDLGYGGQRSRLDLGLVDPQGFEPRYAESESAVLPAAEGHDLSIEREQPVTMQV